MIIMSGKEYTAKSIEEALEKALNEMMLTREDIEYEVLVQPSKGILGFGKKSNMPSDLFLETLPYTETREYGRKLVTSSIMYKTLYSENPDQDFEEIIKLLIEF